MKANPYDCILENIFIGDNFSAEFYGKKFALLVNCAYGLPCPSNHEHVIHLPVLSNHHSDAKQFFELIQSTCILDLIHEKVCKNEPVLLYCLKGVQNSCVLCACYLMKYHHLSVGESIQYVKQKRDASFLPCISLLDTLQMMSFECCTNTMKSATSLTTEV